MCVNLDRQLVTIITNKLLPQVSTCVETSAKLPPGTMDMVLPVVSESIMNFTDPKNNQGISSIIPTLITVAIKILPLFFNRPSNL